MPLSVPLLFHFNQHLNEFARVASHVCYRGLLRVLRSHPDLRFNIHISGTLIHALQWVDPEPLELIRAGLADGQFELLGSTYAQNVPYASDDWDNARQIELHQQVIHDAFGVTPTVFWISERCWRQSLVPLIAAAGYRTTLIENHILAAAGVNDPVVLTTSQDGYELTIIRDDETLKHKLNFAAWFGRPTQIDAYLAERATHPRAGQHCLAYAEDAEAMGLWGWQVGIVPNQTWDHLDQLLTALEANPEVTLIYLSAAPAPVEHLSSIPDGSAAWMDASLARPDAPYHEDGYADWFDFYANSPKLKRFGRMYGRLRQRLQESLDGAPAGARALRQCALQTFLVHQYEFGCIGIGGQGYRGWEGSRAALAAIRASDWAADPQPFMLIEDVTGEGYDEIMLCDGEQLLILAPGGGRLLYWFDLRSGQQFVGNQLAVIPVEYEGDAVLPPAHESIWKPWTPDVLDPRATFPEVKRKREAAPTRMGRYLPDWVWKGEADAFTLPTREMELWDEVCPLNAQRRALVDHLTLDGETEYDPDEGLDYRFEGERVVFIRFLEFDVTLEKTYAWVDGGVEVRYRFRNRDANPHQVQLAITNELCPDYAEVVRRGREALVCFQTEDAVGVQNTITHNAIVIRSDRRWSESVCEEALLALEAKLTFQLEIAPQAEETLVVRLKRQVMT